MNGTVAPPVLNFLSQRARDGVDAGQIADTVELAWGRISAGLAPVIGQRGVGALYKRSLHLAAKAHPWLATAQAGGTDMDVAVLRNELAGRSSAEAAAGGAAVLLGFHTLLVSLIGPALAAQLLGDMWTQLFSGTAAQDPLP